MKKIIIILLLFSISIYAQNRVVYHSFYSTASEAKLVKWMVHPDTLKDLYIKETINNNNQVIELKFMHGQEIAQFTCFEPSIIRFEYEENKIIETRFYADDSKLNFIECREPYKIVYNLKDRFITDCVEYFDFELYLTGEAKKFLNKESLKNIKEHYELRKNGVETFYNYVIGYVYSSAKYNNRSIVSHAFEPHIVRFPYSEEASKSKYAFKNAVQINPHKE